MAEVNDMGMEAEAPAAGGNIADILMQIKDLVEQAIASQGAPEMEAEAPPAPPMPFGKGNMSKETGGVL